MAYRAAIDDFGVTHSPLSSCCDWLNNFKTCLEYFFQIGGSISLGSNKAFG